MFYANHTFYLESQDPEDNSEIGVEVELSCPEKMDYAGCEEYGQVLYFPVTEKTVIKSIPNEFHNRAIEIEKVVFENLKRIEWERDNE